MRYLMKISYDGSNFNGFQRLNDLRTVQGELERVLSVLNKKDVLVKGASRTDKGVHAYGQMVHFDLDFNIPKQRLMYACNRLLPKDIRIMSCEVVDKNFHARFNVVKKKYVYKINLGDYDVLKCNYYYQSYKQLDIPLMKKCAKLFLGYHDFRNFVAGERDNYEMVVDNISFIHKKNILEIEFEGKSFYRYMVRNLVGAMLEVGYHQKTLEDVKLLLNDVSNRRQMLTAEAQGLYLMDIIYNFVG